MGRDGGEKTDGELDSPSEQERVSEFLAVKTFSARSLLQKQKMLGCYFFFCEISVKIATFVYLYMLVCASLRAFV